MSLREKFQSLLEPNDRHVNARIKKHADVVEWLNRTYPSYRFQEQVHLARNGLDAPPVCHCGNRIKLHKGHHVYGLTCSRSCSTAVRDLQEASKKGRETKKARYGEDFDKLASVKAQETMLERYGVRHALQLGDVMEKKNASMMERYGNVTALHLDQFRSSHREALAVRSRSIVDDALNRADSYHGAKGYSYLNRDELKRINDPIIYECPKHGRQEQLLHLHAEGRGCPSCSAEESGLALRKNHTQFVERAHVVHGEKYQYPDEYVLAREKIEIECPKHGKFSQTPNDHLSGYGCPVCGFTLSKAENQIKEFIADLGIEVVQRDRVQIKPYELDLWIPSLNLAIEYCGIIWHSEKFNDDPLHLVKKHELCENKGIRLITIFEDEWIEYPEKVKSTIRHIVGRSDRGVGARKINVREITWAVAKEFLDRHHLLNAGPSGTQRIGAFHGDTLVGVMTFGSPSDERGQTGQIEMKRFVTDGRNHPGLGSKMFKWAVREYSFTEVSAFVDRRWFTGTFKSISGFVCVGTTKPSLFWVHGQSRYHRRFVSKSDLEGPGTKREKLNRLGYYRIWDCGKNKMLWKSE